MDIQQLQEQYGSDDCEIGPDLCGLNVITIKNKAATARISLYGAHVLSYIPVGGRDLLWLSKKSCFKPGIAIRGGIPVCWPWFGKNEENPELPAHGFARLSEWNLESVTRAGDEMTIVTLSLEDTPATKALWPYEFKCTLQVAVGASLTVSLKMLNLDSSPVRISSALHTYFAVGDIAQTRVWGLDDVNYYDKVNNMALRHQEDQIDINGEVDRIYIDTNQPVIIEDGAMKRSITVEREGSESVVVWNPWIEKAARMADFPDEAYTEMLCVEAANAADDARIIQPGQFHTISTTIQGLNA